MNFDVFNMENFNVIEDEEYYYVYRAIENVDREDIINEFLEHNKDIDRIRTYRERYEELHGKAKYSKDSEISLEEMYDHIKMHFLQETNCISLSTNANVSLDYGSMYNDEYVVMKIPKSGKNNVYYAGDFMLFEIFLKIEETLEEEKTPQRIVDLVNRIDSFTTNKEIVDLISIVAKETNYDRNILSRFQNRQYFNNEQQYRI